MLFVQNDKLHLLISANCYQPESSFQQFKQCMALSRLPKASYNKVEAKLKAGQNPGIVICQDLLKGTLVMGVNRKKNKHPFCGFSDGSYIDCGSLVYYGVQNDHRSSGQNKQVK